jgi:hypothetical protein
MGDAKKNELRVGFDSRLRLKFLGSQVTTDARLLAYRELDEALGLTEIAQDAFKDSRLGSNKQHGLSPLLRQSIYGRLAGYDDERLCVDPAMRHVVGGRASQPEKQAASTSEVVLAETLAFQVRQKHRPRMLSPRPAAQTILPRSHNSQPANPTQSLNPQETGDTIKVHVVKHPDRDHLMMRYCDPITGRTRSPQQGQARGRDRCPRAKPPSSIDGAESVWI